jgi:hypothetical protein
VYCTGCALNALVANQHDGQLWIAATTGDVLAGWEANLLTGTASEANLTTLSVNEALQALQVEGKVPHTDPTHTDVTPSSVLAQIASSHGLPDDTTINVTVAGISINGQPGNDVNPDAHTTMLTYLDASDSWSDAIQETPLTVDAGTGVQQCGSCHQFISSTKPHTCPSLKQIVSTSIGHIAADSVTLTKNLPGMDPITFGVLTDTDSPYLYQPEANTGHLPQFTRTVTVDLPDTADQDVLNAAIDVTYLGDATNTWAWSITNINGEDIVTSGAESTFLSASAEANAAIHKIALGWTKCADCGEFANAEHVCSTGSAPDPVAPTYLSHKTQPVPMKPGMTLTHDGAGGYTLDGIGQPVVTIVGSGIPGSPHDYSFEANGSMGIGQADSWQGALEQAAAQVSNATGDIIDAGGTPVAGSALNVCAGCGKPVKKSLTYFKGNPYHKGCVTKASTTATVPPSDVAALKAAAADAGSQQVGADGILVYPHGSVFTPVYPDNVTPNWAVTTEGFHEIQVGPVLVSVWNDYAAGKSTWALTEPGSDGKPALAHGSLSQDLDQAKKTIFNQLHQGGLLRCNGCGQFVAHDNASAHICPPPAEPAATSTNASPLAGYTPLDPGEANSLQWWQDMPEHLYGSGQSISIATPFLNPSTGQTVSGLITVTCSAVFGPDNYSATIATPEGDPLIVHAKDYPTVLNSVHTALQDVATMSEQTGWVHSDYVTPSTATEAVPSPTVTAATGSTCAKCGKTIKKTVITASNGKTYHPSCCPAAVKKEIIAAKNAELAEPKEPRPAPTTPETGNTDPFEVAQSSDDTAALPQPASSGLDGQAALDYLAAHSEDAITPIPDTGAITVGDGIGQHLVLGGDDFYDSAVTVINYKDPAKGVRQVLFAEVTREAEAKLVEAIATNAKMIPTTVTETEMGRLPIDQDNSLYDQIATASKSVNFHLKEQDAIPEHTLATIAKLEADLPTLKSHTTDPQSHQMLDQYQQHVDNLVAWRDNWDAKKAEFASAGAKMPKASPYEVEHEVTKTVMVPAPDQGGGLATKIEYVNVPAVSLDSDGTSTWKGDFASNAGSGNQYRIDLGDGYTALYRPHEINGHDAPQKGMQGQLEILAPPGIDNPAATIARLGRLNLGHTPLTQAEAEYAYLNANVWSQKISNQPAVKAALTNGEAYVLAAAESVAAARMHEALGLDEAGLERWSKSVRLEAERKSLAARTTLLRDAVAQATGAGTGADLIASGDYQPTPMITRSGVKWRRFDVTQDKIRASWKAQKRMLRHDLQGHPERILDVLRTGALVAQSRRRRLGAVANTGMSEGADVGTGGSRTVFLRNTSPTCGSGNYGFRWADPSALLSRTDWYANEGDGYGKMTQHRNPLDIIGFTGSSNEIMFMDGIDIYGEHAPSRIHLPNNLRAQALQIVKSKGITHVNGTPVESWIVGK